MKIKGAAAAAADFFILLPGVIQRLSSTRKVLAAVEKCNNSRSVIDHEVVTVTIKLTAFAFS